jgi:DNA polymerase-3 subunit delta'
VTAVPNNEPEDQGLSGWPIWGHSLQAGQLAQAVEFGRVRHAYLFSGPDRVGKSTLASIFAQALNCAAPVGPGTPCGACLSCRKIARGVHPDVQTYSLASQEAESERKGTKNTTLTIETVRELCAATVLRPMEGRWRVTMVEDAEAMQGIAQEALLKTLEEPPQFMVLILLADDGEVLLPTIRSRCQIVDLRPVSHATIAEGLVANGVAPDQADWIAALSAGKPGWARRASADPTLVAARGEAIGRALAWIETNAYQRLVTAVRLGDGFTKKRTETYADLETLLGVWRDLLLLATSVPSYLTNRGFEDRLRELARSWTIAEIHRAVRAVQTCISDLEANVRPRLAMEAMVLQWPKTTGR